MTGHIIKGVFESTIDIQPVKTFSQLKDFIFLPWRIYKSYPHWSPSLISKEFRRLSRRKNPFFEHSDAGLFVAYQNGKPVGRIAAINNTLHEAFYHDHIGFFGFFETVPDYFIAKRLFLEAEKWCHLRGKRVMQGPVNLSIHEEYGLLFSGFDAKPYAFMPYNPPYYVDYLKRHGFEKAKDLYAYKVDLIENQSSIQQLKSHLDKYASTPKVHFSKAKLSKLRHQLKRAFQDVFNPEWQQQYGYLPLSEAELEFRLREYFKWVIPDLLLIGEVHNEEVGCMIMLPNFNEVIHRFNGFLSPLNNLLLPYYKRHIKSAKCVLLIIKKNYRNYSYHTQFIYEAFQRIKKRGFQTIELGWISEDQIATRYIIEKFGLKPNKTYRLYTKEIQHEHRINKHNATSLSGYSRS